MPHAVRTEGSKLQAGMKTWNPSALACAVKTADFSAMLMAVSQLPKPQPRLLWPRQGVEDLLPKFGSTQALARALIHAYEACTHREGRRGLPRERGRPKNPTKLPVARASAHLQIQ